MSRITVQIVVNASLEKVWRYWTEPEHIEKWAFASDEWECPHAENDLRVSGTFLTRMSAKDGSQSFDLVGTYTAVSPQEKIAYTMNDERTVSVVFEKVADNLTRVIEEFDAESINSEETQRTGWQAILDNFKTYTENN
jgi:uncharacterized protein YndB with AHSA1/START domain